MNRRTWSSLKPPPLNMRFNASIFFQNGADLGRLGALLLQRGAGEFGQKLIEIGFHAAGAHGGVQVGQALLLVGMANGILLEFNGELHARAVSDDGPQVQGR